MHIAIVGPCAAGKTTLQNNLVRLSDAGRADGMTFGLEAAGSVDGKFPVQPGLPAFEFQMPFAFLE